MVRMGGWIDDDLAGIERRFYVGVAENHLLSGFDRVAVHPSSQATNNSLAWKLNEHFVFVCIDQVPNNGPLNRFAGLWLLGYGDVLAGDVVSGRAVNEYVVLAFEDSWHDLTSD